MSGKPEKTEYSKWLICFAVVAFLCFALSCFGFLRALGRLWAGKAAQPEPVELAVIQPGVEPEAVPSPQEIYDRAMSFALGGNYREAAELFAGILQYEDSGRLYSRCTRMAGWLEDEYRTALISEESRYVNDYMYHVYETELAYIAAPEDLSADCRFFLYYPGGKDVEVYIEFINNYFMNPAPDTIAVFLRSNGLYDARTKTFEAIDVLEQAAAERGVFVRELMIVGSSLGAYPAMQAASFIEDETGIKVSCLLSLDAGDDWNSPYVLSQGQCRRLAALGTPFYLFESPWVGTDRKAIYRMVSSGMDVVLVGCENDQHERITHDAMGLGVIHWALGDRTEPCPLDIYTFNKLYV